MITSRYSQRHVTPYSFESGGLSAPSKVVTTNGMDDEMIKMVIG